jgi:hypothetical protein
MYSAAFFWRHRDPALSIHPSRLSFFARENIHGAGKTGCEHKMRDEPNAIGRVFFLRGAADRDHLGATARTSFKISLHSKEIGQV